MWDNNWFSIADQLENNNYANCAFQSFFSSSRIFSNKNMNIFSSSNSDSTLKYFVRCMGNYIEIIMREKQSSPIPPATNYKVKSYSIYTSRTWLEIANSKWRIDARELLSRKCPLIIVIINDSIVGPRYLRGISIDVFASQVYFTFHKVNVQCKFLHRETFIIISSPTPPSFLSILFVFFILSILFVFFTIKEQNFWNLIPHFNDDAKYHFTHMIIILLYFYTKLLYM